MLKSLSTPPPWAASGLTCASGAAAGCTCIGICASHRVQPLERVGERQRAAEDLGAHPVGLELPLPRHGVLDDHRRDRADDQRGDRREGMAIAVVAAAAEHEQVGQVPDGARHARRDRRDQHVAVLDVGELVRDDALQLLGRHVAQDPGSDRDDGFARVPSGGERVGLFLLGDGHPGHGEPRALAQAIDHAIKLGGVLLRHDAGAVHREHHAVGEEVHDEIHGAAEHQGHDEALLSAQSSGPGPGRGP